MTDVVTEPAFGLVFGLTVVAVWAWAGLRAGAVAHAATPRQMSRRIAVVLGLSGVGLLLALARVMVAGLLAPAGWWFAALALPLLLVPAIAVVTLSVPRLVGLGRAARAFSGVDAMAPSVRHAAAHPLVAWPIQLTAIGAMAGGVVVFLVPYPASVGACLALLGGVGAAALATWRHHAARHARLAGQVIVPSVRRGTLYLAQR